VSKAAEQSAAFAGFRGMSEHTAQGVLKRLAVMALALATGAAEAPSDLANLPAAAVEPLLEDDELDQMSSVDRGRLFRLLAGHPSPQVRESIAMRVLESQSLTPDLEMTLGALVRDPHPAVRWTAIGWFASFLQRLDGMDQLALVSDWVLADSPFQRLAVACALPKCITPVAAEALELLTGDEDPGVRAAARHAKNLHALSRSAASARRV
jgi:hypothetical protein